MWLLVMIALVALVAILGCAFGESWGPVILGLGFAGFGALLLMSGYRSPWPETGLVFLGGSVVEFAAAGRFWRWSRTDARPPIPWRTWAASVGVAGSLLGVMSLGVFASAAIGVWSPDALPSGFVFPSPPVVLHARGEAWARLDGVTGFTTHRGSADCTSGPGSQVVVHVEGWDMGAVRGAVFRGETHIHMVGLGSGEASVLVYFWSSSMTGAWPTWGGPGQLVTDKPSGGRVTFEGLGATGQYAPGWPNELSGEISWSCGPWSSAPATYGP